jgi:hypothetical protein
MTNEQQITQLQAQLAQLQKNANPEPDPLAGIERFTIDPAELEAYGFTPQQAKFFDHMAQKLVLEAVQTSGVLHKKAFGDYEQRTAPALEYAREYGRDRFFSKFYEKAPKLKSHDKLVRQFLPTLQSDPNLPQDEAELFDAIAKRFEETYKDSIPGLSSQAVAQGSNGASVVNSTSNGSRPAALVSTAGSAASSGEQTDTVPAWMR